MKTNALNLVKYLILAGVVTLQTACESPNAHKGGNVIVSAETTGMASQAAKPLQVAPDELPLFADETWQGTFEKEWQVGPDADRQSLDREPAARYMGPYGFGASRTFGSGLDRPFGENRVCFGLFNYSF